MKQTVKMKELRQDDRPYEKCLEKGPEVLTDSELLSVILRCGVQGIPVSALAGSILETCRDLRGLCRMSPEQLTKLKGVGKVKAIQLCCITELAKRIAREEAQDRMSFQNAESVALYLMEQMRYKDQEEMRLLMLDSRLRLIDEKVIFKGTVNMAPASPREIFIRALEQKAVYIVIAHNHPGGDPTPGREDVDVTLQIAEAGSMLGIHLIDHIIIGDGAYRSMREMGYLGEEL